MGRISSIRQQVASLDGDYLLTSDVARIIGVTPIQINAWRRRDPIGLGPSFGIQMGSRLLSLYTREDVERLKKAKPGARERSGPKRVWTAEEKLDRHRLMMRAGHTRRRAGEREAQGLIAEARELYDRADRISAELQEQRARRMADTKRLAAVRSVTRD